MNDILVILEKLLDRKQFNEAAKLKHALYKDKSIGFNALESAIASRNETLEIAKSISETLSLLENLQDKVQSLASDLKNIKDNAFQMEEKEQAVEVQNKNLNDTHAMIEDLIENLGLPAQIQRDLFDLRFDDLVEAESMEKSLQQLEKVLKFKVNPQLKELACVKNQKEHAESLKSKFCFRFRQYFTTYIDYTLSEYSEFFINNIYNQPLTLISHDVIHNHLITLLPMIRWIERNDASVYHELSNFYASLFQNQYDKELKTFFDCAKEKMAASKAATRNQALLSQTDTLADKKRYSIGYDGSTKSNSLSGAADYMETSSAKSSEINYTEWEEFDSSVEKILNAIDPTCRAEQRFYTSFFPMVDPEIATQRLVGMFHIIESEFVDFANHYNELDGLYSLYLLVRLSQYVLSERNTKIFLHKIYSRVLLQIKRNFDNFMQQQLQAIRETKAPKRSKCGVLGVVKRFEQFATQVESAFKSIGDRRTDIDRYYLELVPELFKTIDRIEHHKTPTEMIRLENYSYLVNALRSIKVPCLENQSKEAKLHYKAALNAYVSRYFGRPLEKLNTFLDGVQTKIAQGVKEEEISFQLAYSKQELRKVLLSVSLKEVRKGLEEMYRRIEKHASDTESNLIQVIWHAMQDEFLSQYKAIQAMIERCYPSTNSSLTFTINDILQVFSDIAQSH